MIVSVDNFVFCSKNQIKIAPKNKNKKAPKEISFPKIKAKATPGNAKWDKGSTTIVIFLESIKEPKYPATPPTNIPEIKISKKLVPMIMFIKFYFLTIKL